MGKFVFCHIMTTDAVVDVQQLSDYVLRGSHIDFWGGPVCVSKIVIMAIMVMSASFVCSFLQDSTSLRRCQDSVILSKFMPTFIFLGITRKLTAKSIFDHPWCTYT